MELIRTQSDLDEVLEATRLRRAADIVTLRRDQAAIWRLIVIERLMEQRLQAAELPNMPRRELECLKCGHHWESRLKDRIPTHCPNCCNRWDEPPDPNWPEERRNKTKQKSKYADLNRQIETANEILAKRKGAGI